MSSDESRGRPLFTDSSKRPKGRQARSKSRIGPKPDFKEQSEAQDNTLYTVKIHYAGVYSRKMREHLVKGPETNIAKALYNLLKEAIKNPDDKEAWIDASACMGAVQDILKDHLANRKVDALATKLSNAHIDKK